MRNIVEETYDRLINKWGSKEYKGIGTINCVPPVDYCEIISRIISLMRNKNDNIKILIVTDNWKRRTEIVDGLKNHNINIDTIIGKREINFDLFIEKYNSILIISVNIIMIFLLLLELTNGIYLVIQFLIMLDLNL